MKTERELFEGWFPLKHLFNYLYWSEEQKNYVYNQYDEEHCRAYEYVNSSWSAWCASAQREGYKLVPVEPTEEMWGGLARHLVKYMQGHDRYCPKTLGKYINRFIGFKNIPDWLNKEIPDWESDHAFATADLGVFIYKAMIEAA